MADEPIPAFGALLRRYRLAAGLTQEALAERAGLSGDAVGVLERGARQAPHQETVDLLARALGLPAPERARFLAAAPRPHRPPTTPPPDRPRHNLPAALTSFVGREQDLAAVQHLLEHARLVTLTGPGGIGKTRLAVEVARVQSAAYPVGVWLAELAALTDPRLVPQAVAVALGVAEQPGRPLLATLSAAVQQRRRLLLVLDNCEHVLDACATLAAALLAAGPQVQFLATSRAPLRLPGEARYRLPPLTLPEPGARRLATLVRSDAVQLFMDRAGLVQSTFTLTDDNAAAVVQVCRRLDGIPLALELAAGRLGGLPVATLAARLEESFRLLTGGSRAALPRQQTLRATLDWSYDLLGDQERALFQRLAVFAGGWTLEAAEAVGAGESIARDEVLELLAQLVEQSLAVVEEQPAGTARYRLLEPLRQYGRDRLAASGGAEAVGARHAAYYLALAEAAEPHFWGAQEAVWHRRLAAEHENLWAALQWWLDRRDAEYGLRLWVALWDYWYRHGYLREAGARLMELLTLADAAPSALRVRALLIGVSVASAAPIDRARLVREALALAQELGDARSLAHALGHMGFEALGEGRYAEARRWLGESVAASRVAEDLSWLAHGLCFRGRAANALGDYAGARADLEEALDLARQAGDQFYTGMALEFLGELASTVGGEDEARTHLEAALALYQELGDKTGVASVGIFLGGIAWRQGDVTAAQQWYRSSLEQARAVGSAERIADALAGLAIVAAGQEQPDWALRLAGAAEGYRAANHLPAAPHDRARLELALRPARSALAEPAAAAAWAAGLALSLEQVVADALMEDA